MVWARATMARMTMVFKESGAPSRIIFGTRPCAPPLQRVHVTKENGDKFDDIPPEQHALVPSFVGGGGNRIHPLPYADSNLPVQPRSMDLSKDIGADGELEAEAGEAASHRIDGGKD
ncbi:putative cellulose synthase catalytic subunit [Hordeum vulgare]|nr:putative cellulose synthase catalytic subunit [Hordeum vulgare]